MVTFPNPIITNGKMSYNRKSKVIVLTTYSSNVSDTDFCTFSTASAI